jgi:hypothetical protein
VAASADGRGLDRVNRALEVVAMNVSINLIKQFASLLLHFKELLGAA